MTHFMGFAYDAHIKDSALWSCDKCGRVYNSEEAADRCSCDCKYRDLVNLKEDFNANQGQSTDTIPAEGLSQATGEDAESGGKTGPD